MYIYIFLKGWNIGHLRLGPEPDGLALSLFFLFPHSIVFNLYHIQDYALGMPTDLSAIPRLMAAIVPVRPLITWDHSRYLVSPAPY